MIRVRHLSQVPRRNPLLYDAQPGDIKEGYGIELAVHSRDIGRKLWLLAVQSWVAVQVGADSALR